jgi:hypothetical protein
VSCIPQGPCIAVDYSGQVFALSGGHVASLGEFGVSTYGISCPAPRFCVAVSDDGVLVVRRRVIGYPLTYSPESNTHWQSISCPTETFCMAGGGVIGGRKDGAGVVASWNGRSWSPVRVVVPDIPAEAKTQISSMSCTSATFCVAADQNERTLRWNGRTWSLIQSLDVLGDSFHVSCTSRNFCLAIGTVTNATLTWNGRTWGYRGIDGINDGSEVVSCRSAVDCVALDASGFAQRRDVNGWRNLATIGGLKPDVPQAISCSPSGFCEAVTAQDHFVYLYDPRRPPVLPVLCTTLGCRVATT